MCFKSSNFAADFDIVTKIMKKIIVLIVALMPFIGIYAAKADRQTVVLSCDLQCQGCCDKIMKNIAFEKGVKDIICDLKSKTVTVTFDAAKTDLETLLKAFERIKKPATVLDSGEQKTDEQQTKQP